MRSRFFDRNKNDDEEKIAQLLRQREACSGRIRTLRDQLLELEERYASADDLDRKIIEVEKTEKQGILDAETVHFQDLGDLIARMQKVRRIERTKKSLMEVLRISDLIDTGKMRKDEDEVAVRREMLAEETE